MNEKIFNKKNQKPTRQALRNRPTKAEYILWLQLRKSACLGYKFRRQQGIGPFIVDFYCPELKLAIEVDGYTQDSDEAKIKDARRQRFIEELGIHVLRFGDEVIHENCNDVLEKIQETIRTIEASKDRH